MSNNNNLLRNSNKLTTTQKKKFIDSIEIQLLKEHNKIRNSPSLYIPILAQTKKLFRKNNVLHFYKEMPFKTYEGLETIDEAINFLSTQKPLKSFILSSELIKSSKDIAYELGTNGIVNHSKNLPQYIEKYCEWGGMLCENIDFGTKQAENIMIKLLLNDGIKERFQRLNIFKPELKYIGISQNSHIKYGICTVIHYAMNITPLGHILNEKSFIKEYLNTTLYSNIKNKVVVKKNVEKKEIKENQEIKNIDNNIKDQKYIKEEKFSNSESEESFDIDYDDEYVPENTIKNEYKLIKKNLSNFKCKIHRKIYTLKNGNVHIVEELKDKKLILDKNLIDEIDDVDN
jgi:hypothetical protein